MHHDNLDVLQGGNAEARSGAQDSKLYLIRLGLTFIANT